MSNGHILLFFLPCLIWPILIPLLHTDLFSISSFKSLDPLRAYRSYLDHLHIRGRHCSIYYYHNHPHNWTSLSFRNLRRHSFPPRPFLLWRQWMRQQCATTSKITTYIAPVVNPVCISSGPPSMDPKKTAVTTDPTIDLLWWSASVDFVVGLIWIDVNQTLYGLNGLLRT